MSISDCVAILDKNAPPLERRIGLSPDRVRALAKKFAPKAADKRPTMHGLLRRYVAKRDGPVCTKCGKPVVIDGPRSNAGNFALVKTNGDDACLVCRNCSRPQKGERHRNKDFVEIADRLKKLRVHRVIRIPLNGAPSRRWFKERANLHSIVVRQHNFDGDRIILRIK